MEPIESQNSITNPPLNFGRWLVLWILGTFATWTCIYYVLFHIALHIPINLLYRPAVIHVGSIALVGPLMFKGVYRFRLSHGRELGLLYLSAGLIMSCTAICWTYFGLREGVIPSDQAGGLYIVVVPGSILGPIGAFYVRRMRYQRSRVK